MVSNIIRLSGESHMQSLSRAHDAICKARTDVFSSGCQVRSGFVDAALPLRPTSSRPPPTPRHYDTVDITLISRVARDDILLH